MGTDLPKLLEELAAPPGSPQARLIEQLINDGASTEEIRAAHRESRLTLLPLDAPSQTKGGKHSPKSPAATI